MSNEQDGLSIGWMTAAADLSGKQFYVVKCTADAAFNLTSSAGEKMLGILQDKPLSGNAGNVMAVGISKVLTGTGDLAAGENWQAVADGTAITASTADVPGGTVLIGASAGEYATVTVGFASAGQLNA